MSDKEQVEASVDAPIDDVIRDAQGAHAVYLAATHDPRINTSITTNRKGGLLWNGRKLDESGIANILVYLSGRYAIRPSSWELTSGLIAAAKSVDQLTYSIRRHSYTQDEYTRVCKALESMAVDDGVTTLELGVATMPQEYEKFRRATEMKIASILRVLGFKSKRMTFKRTRTYRWFKAEDVQGEE